ERAAIRFDADTTYTRALAALAHARLSRRTARDADSLLTMARLRREVGDVSELDVRLAEVNAGQLENVAVDDSLAALDALLAVQFVMGLPADVPTITLSDSLVPTGTTPVDTTGGGDPLPVVAAAATLRSAERTLTFAHRSVFAAPTIQVGFERGDPTEPAGTVLPTFGVSWPFPLFNWNRGEIGQARAARDRAQAQLDLTRRESAADLSRARRLLVAALERVARGRRLLASADRVAAMSLRAYAEGAVPLANVLEAQRNAREALGRYIDDVALLNDAAGAVRLLTASRDQRVPPGDTLIEFERAPFDAAAQSATTALDAAQRNYARAARLVQAGILPQKDSDQAASDLAQAQVAAVTARRAQQLATLRAPLAGVVTRMTAVLGASVDPSQALIQIADPGALDVVFNVSPGEAADIHVGDSVVV